MVVRRLEMEEGGKGGGVGRVVWEVAGDLVDLRASQIYTRSGTRGWYCNCTLHVCFTVLTVLWCAFLCNYQCNYFNSSNLRKKNSR